MRTKTKAKVTYKLRKDDSEHRLDADVVLVATGRRPYTDGLGLEALGVEMTDRGQVETDAHWRTNVPGIYAIGDVHRRARCWPTRPRTRAWPSPRSSRASTAM
jgi:dihydrolipoamide dehydrogenase